MRMTSTTRVPVRANEITAAGPVAWTTTPLPTNRPAPITPPSAIICMCRRCRVRLRPWAGPVVILSTGTGRVTGGGHRSKIARRAPSYPHNNVLPESNHYFHESVITHPLTCWVAASLVSPALKINHKVTAAVLAALTAHGTCFAADAPDSGASDAPDSELTVTVTAQRRAESVQDVPITVQAITGDQLKRLNVASFDDIVKFLPNVSFGSNGPG